VRTKIFRREWVFPALALAFVSASAEASRDDLSAQAAAEMHCGSVSIVQTSPTEFLASGCGDDRTYRCRADGECAADVDPQPAATTTSEEDDEAAEAVASALTDLACACASAGLESHGSHHHHGHHNHSSSHTGTRHRR
jgi:hypothetical protein